MQRAIVNANKKPVHNVHLSHLSQWRDEISNQNSKQDTAKLEVIHSFARVRQILQKEIEGLCGDLPKEKVAEQPKPNGLKIKKK